MKSIIFPILLIFAFLDAWAINPLDHTSLLQKNDAENPRRKEVAIDEENPYFILMGEAEKAMKEGDYHTAVFRLQDAIRVDPDNASTALLYSNLGLAYNRLDQDSLALAAYDHALEIAPSMTTVLNNRALLKLKMGRDVEAYQDFTRVIERDSLNADALFYHGIISLYGGKINMATKDFSRLKVLDPDSYNTCVALSTLFSLTGEDRQAIPYFKKLIELDPSVEYYAALAGCYLAIEDLSEAGAIIAEGMNRFGDDAELYYYRAWLKRDSYLMEEAQADAKKAVSLGANRQKVEALFTRTKKN